MEGFQTSNVSVSNGNIKCPIGKSILTANLQKHFGTCKCWHRKSKVSPYIIWYVFGPLAGEVLPKSYSPKCTKFWVFWQKTDFKKTNFTIFQCPKNYGSVTRVTRSKVAPSMADPTRMKHSVKGLKRFFIKRVRRGLLPATNPWFSVTLERNTKESQSQVIHLDRHGATRFWSITQGT